MYLTMSDGAQLFVREFGQGQPILVLSGLGMTSAQWIPFLYPFRQHYRFIIPDWRGFGGSKHCAIPHSDAIRSHWQDVQSILEQLNLTRTAVIAYSMGASTAMYGMQYANFAEHITAYLHIDQSPCIKNQSDWTFGLYGEQQVQFLNLLQALRASLNNAQTIQQLTSLQQKRLLYAWKQLMAFQGSHPVLLKVVAQLSHFPRFAQHLLPLKNLNMMAWYLDTYLQHDLDLRQSLSKLKCPITWMSGQHSALYPILGQQLLAQKLQATHVILPNSGHAPLVSQPLQFYRAIRQFLLHIPA